ncbi:MAG: HoxN/HupN/NixA family nickel/cobalt transporter [Ktedonobacteraceae bacterium]|nr:HoxN/HupN/NixA family nickel/cobalt transporter [Ktedonobacteraceae bacterium]
MSSNFSLSALSRVFHGSSAPLRKKIISIYIVLITCNILAWIIALVSFSSRYPALLGTALLAYSFGLRHAVDADHISAIDNVTRKLMQEKKRPIAVGLFFSLGHSTIVVALSVVIAIAAAFAQNMLPVFQSAGSLIGTSVSALFLFIIALINIVVLWDIFRAFQKVKRGEEYDEHSLNEFLDQRGLMGRFFRPLLKMTDKSWKMYPLGVLFGLGFDTATEIGLLGISAAEASKGLPVIYILIFPLLFMAGMTLLDTTDGILMLGAYGWAFVKPVRKLYYNMNITLVSVLVALIIGTLEVLSIVSELFKLNGSFWDFLGALDFGIVGGIIIGVFILSWIISAIIYRLKRYDDLGIQTAASDQGYVRSGGD